MNLIIVDKKYKIWHNMALILALLIKWNIVYYNKNNIIAMRIECVQFYYNNPIIISLYYWYIIGF